MDFIKTSYGYHVCCIQQAFFGTEIKNLVWVRIGLREVCLPSWVVGLCDKTLLATNLIVVREKNMKKVMSTKIFSVRSEGSAPPVSQICMRLKRKARNLLHPFPMLPSKIVTL